MSTALAQIHLKAPSKIKSYLQQAAELSGAANLTDYILRAALERAEKDMTEQRTFLLGDEAWGDFAKRLEAPARSLPKLRALLNSPDAFDKPTRKA